MERVQFQQEQMLPELKDLEEKGVFTKQEIKQILKKRTAFEMALVRRVAKKSDYVQYLGYEMQLETLRRKRVKRLKLNSHKKTISDYALVRRQLHIFERALGKFKDDVGLWVQYIRLAQREGARTLAGKICARALRLHPNVPALYVLAASHELTHLSPATARTLLQRGLRINAESIDLWREYVRMELGYVESLRRRWETLGVPSSGERQEEGQDNGEESESARQMVLDGEIVRTVIANAAKAVPQIELFEALQEVLLSHPWRIRHGMMEHLHACLDAAPESVRGSARAAKLRATRRLGAELRGAELVERLGEASAALAGEARARGGGEASAIFADFAAFWCGAHDDKKGAGELVDANLREFLVASLEKTLRACGRGSARSALETHVRLVGESVGDGERAGRIRARYGLGGAE